MAFFSKKFFEENPSKLIHHIQFPLQFKLYKNIFIITTIIYFVFFGFLSNFFIIFNNDVLFFFISQYAATATAKTPSQYGYGKR